MRVTFGTKYDQMNYHQNTLANKLNDANSKIASGLKIQQGYQDASVFNRDLKLDYDTTTLAQVVDVASTAQTHTLNTDKSLSAISEAMAEFKTKLLQAANNVHSNTSRKAIAQDLRAIKEHIINIANTSIGGEYLFAGSKVDKMPFDLYGNYYGNDEKLSMLIASRNKVPYNITGKELFFGRDTDKTRLITSNIRLLNQTRLNPEVMETPNNHIPSEEVYIKTTDTLRDLVGDNDDNPNNDGKEYFYLRGVGPDGLSFKSKFALDRGYSNRTNATTMQDLLDKIGKEYGNTSQNKVVDVKLSPWGEIEIRDLKLGSSIIQFHMISSDKDVNDVSELYSNGARITDYNQSPFSTQHSISNIQSIRDFYDKTKINFNTTFVTSDNQFADRDTELSHIFSKDTESIVLRLKNADSNNQEANKDNKDPTELRVNVKDTSVKDLIRQIKKFYNDKVDAEMSNGKLILYERGSNKGKNLQFELRTLDKDGHEVAGIATDYKTEYDQTYFLNQGSKLVSNIPQSLSDGSGLANESSRLEEVSGKSLKGSTFNLTLQDCNGVPVNARIDLNDQSYLVLPSKEGSEEYRIPLYDAHTTDVQSSSANRVTYRQLMDAMTIALNYSNQNSETLKMASGKPSAMGRNAFSKLLQDANNRMNISLDDQGRVLIHDTVTSNTKMRFMFSNASTNDFSEKGIEQFSKNITLNANNALTVTQPQMNLFEQLDQIIDAVDRDIYRPGAFKSFGADMRNIGVQNGIAALDDLSDHIEKIIALNGSHGKIFENIIQRNEVLKTQVETMKAENIGVDIADTYNKFSNLNNNYNAVLNSTNKINQMSLVNYL